MRILGMIYSLRYLFVIIGFVAGILHIITGKQSIGKRVIVGLVMMTFPFFIIWILQRIYMRVYFNF